MSAPEDTSTDNRLRRNVLLAVAAAIVLALLIVYTALSGMAKAEVANAQSTTLLTAQQYQQQVDEAHDALHSDVLLAVLPPEVSGLTTGEVQTQTGQHVAELRADIARLDGFTLPDRPAGMVRQLRPSLESYAAQSEALVALTATNRPEATKQLPAFEAAFQGLDQPQTTLTEVLAQEAASARATADVAESDAVRWTWVAAALTVVLLVGLGFVLARIATTNTRLLREIRESASDLASSNEQLDAAQAVAHVGSWEWSPATGETHWSSELYRILGVTPSSAGDLREQFRTRVHPEDAARVEADDQAARRGDRDLVESTYRIVRPDGTVRDVQSRTAAVTDRHGARALVGTVQDVTELRAAQRAKDEFVSVVSHELRTPLTSIRGALGLLAGGAVGALPAKAQRMVEVAVTSSDRLVRLINDILDVEKMAAGKLKLDLAPQPVEELVGAAVGEMRPMADQAGVSLVVDHVDGTVFADRDRVAQTLTNLISNAIKFSPSGGVVTVAAGLQHGEVHFTVTDQGRGIPKNQLEAIFDRFQQVDPSNTREKGGTGLGLPICRGIVEQHGGRIWATSEEARGRRWSSPSAARAPTPRRAPLRAASCRWAVSSSATTTRTWSRSSR